MDVIVSVIVLFSRTEGKYIPQDKGQKKKSLYVLLKTKVMYWISTFTFAIICMRRHVNGVLVAFEYWKVWKRFGLPCTGIRWKRSPKTRLFKNALQSEDFWKCSRGLRFLLPAWLTFIILIKSKIKLSLVMYLRVQNSKVFGQLQKRKYYIVVHKSSKI